MQEARDKARAGAGTGWLAMVLDHHVEIEDCFAAVKAATTGLNPHGRVEASGCDSHGASIAEESVIYPAMALTDQKGRSTAEYPSSLPRRSRWRRSTISTQ